MLIQNTNNNTTKLSEFKTTNYKKLSDEEFNEISWKIPKKNTPKNVHSPSMTLPRPATTEGESRKIFHNFYFRGCKYTK